jgi:hypothetical protein
MVQCPPSVVEQPAGAPSAAEQPLQQLPDAEPVSTTSASAAAADPGEGPPAATCKGPSQPQQQQQQQQQQQRQQLPPASPEPLSELTGQLPPPLQGGMDVDAAAGDSDGPLDSVLIWPESAPGCPGEQQQVPLQFAAVPSRSVSRSSKPSAPRQQSSRVRGLPKRAPVAPTGKAAAAVKSKAPRGTKQRPAAQLPPGTEVGPKRPWLAAFPVGTAASTLARRARRTEVPPAQADEPGPAPSPAPSPASQLAAAPASDAVVAPLAPTP